MSEFLIDPEEENDDDLNIDGDDEVDISLLFADIRESLDILEEVVASMWEIIAEKQVALDEKQEELASANKSLKTELTKTYQELAEYKAKLGDRK